jgi:hypothetical protein
MMRDESNVTRSTLNENTFFNEASAANKAKKLIVTLPHNATPEIIHNLSKFFNTCKAGQCKVFLHHQQNKLETPFSIEHHPALLEEIKKLVQGGTAEIA